MKYNINFNEFLLGLLLEDKGKSTTELPFVLSDRLEKIIKSFPDNIVSKKLITAHNMRMDKKMTMIDIDEKEYDKFTFTNSNKYWDNQKDKGADLIKYKIIMDNPNFGSIDDNENIYKNDWSILRTSIKIGRFINKLYSNEFHNTEIEEFVNIIKTKRKVLDDKGDGLKIVEGEDIKKYYLSDNYDGKAFGGSPLGSSCMNKSSCQDYIDFYAKNKGVKLVVLMSDKEEDKIIGRALLWNIEYIDDQKVDRKFMDRIYYVEYDDVGIFKEYAKKNNWLYKKNQDMDNDCRIYDPEKEELYYYKLRTTNNFVKSDTYPYMDTMKWFFVDGGFLTNDEDLKDGYQGEDVSILFLESTGGYSEEENERGIYVEYYGRYIDENELTYCEYGNDHRRDGDYYFLESTGECATERYFNDNMFEYDDDYYFNDDGIYSGYLDKMIPSESAFYVYRDADYETLELLLDAEGDGDIYDDNDNEEGVDYFAYYDNINNKIIYFDKNYCSDEFIDVRTDDSDDPGIIKQHRVWDKDNHFKWKGNYYADVLNLKDKVIGQKRIWKDENDI